MRAWWLLILLCVPHVAAHASPTTTDPAQLSGLREPPEYISITYTEPLAFDDSSIGIYDDLLLRRDAGDAFVDPDDPYTVKVYAGNLIPGIYTVSYDMRSALDGHRERGSVPLTIGVPCWACLEGDSQPQGFDPAATQPMLAIASAVAAIGLAMVAGGLQQEVLGGPRRPTLATTGIILAGAGTWLQTLQLPASSTLTHQAMLARLAAICFLTAGLAFRRQWLAWIGLVATTAAWPLAGHGARSVSAWAWQATHLAAMLVWTGGLIALPGLWRQAGSDVRHRVLVRFSKLALGAVAVLALTGAMLAISRLKAVDDLWRSAYGQVLSFKLSFMIAALALALGNHRRIWAAIGRWTARAWTASADSATRRSVRIEAGVVVVAILITGVLGVQTIPADRPDPPGEYVDEGWIGDYHVFITVSPTREDGTLPVGDHIHRVRLLDAADAPISGAHVELRFTHQSLADIGEIREPMEAIGNGWYQAAGSFLGAIGRWEQTVDFTPPGTTRSYERVFEIDMGKLGHFHGGSSVNDPHFDTGYLRQGASYTRYFGDSTVGYFLYHCHPHQWMVGSILVDPEAPRVPGDLVEVRIYGNQSDPQGSMYFEPKDVVIPPGTQVRWVNLGDAYHTATNVRWYELDDPNRPDLTGGA